MRPRVVHAVQRFLPRSETFVNTVVNAHRRYDASVLCQSRLNADEFPFPRIDVHPKPLQKGGPPVWIAGYVDASVDRAARLGDGFIMDGGTDSKSFGATFLTFTDHELPDDPDAAAPMVTRARPG